MKRLRPLLGRGRHDRELAHEIQAHIEMATREHIARGKPPDEARAAALREFGNVALVRQMTREMSPWTLDGVGRTVEEVDSSLATAATFRAALFGVTPVDLATYGTVFVRLAVVCVLASYFPAWQAGRVNVIDAPRQE